MISFSLANLETIEFEVQTNTISDFFFKLIFCYGKYDRDVIVMTIYVIDCCAKIAKKICYCITAWSPVMAEQLSES